MRLTSPPLSSKPTERRATAPADIRTVEALRYYDGDEWTVLTSDLAGFTRTVRKHGIVFFASIILQMRHLLRHCWEQHGAVFIAVEGDNFIVVFPNRANALRAALEGVQVIREFNTAVPSTDFAINLSGFGLASGSGLLESIRSGKLFGRVADQSFLLGEHLCENAKILCTRTVAEALGSHADFADLRAVPQTIHENIVDFEVFALEGDFGAYKVNKPAPRMWHNNDGTARDTFSKAVMLERPRLGADVAKFDNRLAAQYGVDRFCLLIGLDWAQVTRRHHVEDTVVVAELAVKLMQHCAQQFGGESVEDHIFFVEDAESAVQLGLAIQEAVRAHNSCVPDNRRIPLLGAAVHYGMLLMVEGEFHTGDPLTTASKIAEDSAQGGSVYITQPVRDALNGSELERLLHLRACEFNVSEIQLRCFEVGAASSKEVDAAAPGRFPWMGLYGQIDGLTESDADSSTS